MAANLGSLNVLLGLDSAQFTTALNKADHQGALFARKLEKEFGSTSVAADKLAESVSGIDKSLSRIAKIQIAPILYKIAKESVGAADAYGQYSSRLQQATESTEEFKAVQAQLLDTSNRVYKSYEDANELFIRTNTALKELGYGAKEAADLVSTIQFGLTIDSADTQKTKSVIDAISKSILTGKMGMDQFNTVVSASPSLFQALADSIAGGSQQALRKMVSDGKLTANELIKVTKQMETLGRKADDMPATVADGFVKLRNNFAKFSGDMTEATGATQLLVSGIDLVANNIQGLTAATVAYFGTGFVAKLYESGKAIYLQVSASRQQLLIEKEIAQVKAHRLGIGVKEMQADIAKMSGISRLVAVEQQLVPLQHQHTAAIASATTATHAYASATSILSKSLSLLGGPLGLLTLGLTAASFASFTGSIDEAPDSIDRLGLSVDQYGEKLKSLTKIQLNVEASELKRSVDEAINTLNQSAYSVDFGTRAANGFRHMFLEVARQNDLTVDQMDTALQGLIDKYKNESVFEGNGETQLRGLSDNILKAKQKLNELTQKQERLNGAMQKTGDISAKAFAPPLGMEKWGEYLAKLEEARDIVGMTTRQLAVYKAAQQGANEAQQKVAGIVAEQEAAYKDLENAVKNKDAKAIAAAKNNIAALDIEQQKVALLAQQMASVAAAAEAFKQGKVSGDVQAGFFTAMNLGFAKRQQEITQSAESLKQADNILKNTVPGASKKGGGGSAAKSELAEYIKSLQEQVFVLGLSEQEAQKYKISLMQGSEAAKAQAASLVDAIARHKEEAETLKQNRALFEELAVFRNQQFEPLMMMGMGDRARDQMSEALSIQADYAAKRRELDENQESESTRISDEAYRVRLAKLIKAENAKLGIIEEAYRLRQEKEANWALGVSEALNNYSSETANVYQSMNNTVSSAFKGMEDALVSFVATGKADFKDLANSIISDMVRIAIQQSVMGPLANALGGMFGGGFNSSGMSSLGGAGSTGAYGFGHVGWAMGGYTGHGGKYEPAGIVHRGEGVLTQEEVRKLGGVWGFESFRKSLRGYATGGVVGQAPSVPVIQKSGGGSVQVNVINRSNTPVSGNAKISTDGMGRMVIDVLLDDLSRNGPYAQALKRSQG